jgi:hypothetical protein
MPGLLDIPDAQRFATTIKYYKQENIRKAIANQCRNKEVAVRYGKGFGKRPEIIIYDRDVQSFAQKKATSFHVSEETWSNPSQLDTGLRRLELDDLRVGWDLIIDVDFPIWQATKLITHKLIQALLSEGVPKEAVSVKFSGNKGFHIGVPFEAFPETYLEGESEYLMSDLFPDGVRRIVDYLAHKVDGPQNNYSLSEELVKIPEVKNDASLLITVDEATGEQVSGGIEGNSFVCPKCEHDMRSDDDYLTCEKCGALMQRIDTPKTVIKKRRKVQLAIDAMLISSRHMYRMAYSLHETSGLVSLPIRIDEVLGFEKEQASPDSIETSTPFLDRDVDPGCANTLLFNAMKFRPPNETERKSFEEIEWVGEAAPEEIFPPMIKEMLSGMRDGRKRALFVLTNFLASVGWSEEMIEARLLDWNEQLPDPLRENDIVSHLRYHKRKKNVLPPNFDNNMYYQDVLGDRFFHDELSSRVKNPVQYVRLMLKRAKTKKPEKRNT